MSKRFQHKYQFRWSDYLFLILIGVFILFLRSAHTITMPHLYTEDGVWISQLWGGGFWKAVLQSKGSYLVFGNIFLLKISLVISRILAGDNLKYLPEIISLISYLFYSSCAAFFVFTFKDIMRKFTVLFIWMLILLIPFGNHTYEILGRLSNSGFLFFLLSFCIICYRYYYKNLTKPIILATDMTLLICAITNPACYITVGCFYLYVIGKRMIHNKPKSLKDFMKALRSFEVGSLITTCMLLFISAVYVLLTASRSLVSKPEIMWNEVIEFFARNLLYPFVFPFYNKLNNYLVVFLFIIIILVFILTYKLLSIEKKKIFVISILACMFGTVLTLISRSEMTHILENYTHTFPDRYFYINNIMFLIPIGFIFELSFETIRNERKAICKKCHIVLVSAFVLLVSFMYISSADYLFEYKSPRFGLPSETFVDRVNSAVINNKVTIGNPVILSPEGKKCYYVEIENAGWNMWIPFEYAHATYLDTRKGVYNLSESFQLAAITDDNWENGISRNAPTMLMENIPILYKMLSGVMQIKTGNTIINLISISETGGYLYLECEQGADLSPFAYPAEIEVIR